MKRMWMSMVVLALASGIAMGQKTDEARMERDIAVAENVLQTLIRQQFENQRTFFQLEINGAYQAGYGVTFRMPADFTTPVAFNFPNGSGGGNVRIWDGGQSSYTYRYDSRSSEPFIVERRGMDDRNQDVTVRGSAPSDSNEKIRLKERNEISLDSIRDAYNARVIDASKTFIADYGDMISQLGSTEKIVVTNQGEQPKMWMNRIVSAPNRTVLAVEANKADLMQYKQGKITRDQFMKKIKVVDTEVTNEVEPDFELLSSIFNRLYRQDLSTTYFSDGNSYERLKDFGVVYYMHVYSSNEAYQDRFDMPTLNMSGITQEERDKKVKEVYPKFENEFKENIIEYGRTVKSLKPEESLIFNIKLTKCTGCGIPQSLELSIKGSVLSDYNAGKIDRNAALGKIVVKKGSIQ